MGVYSLILSISSIAGVALAIPLFSVFDLAGAMFFWAIFSFVALVVYYPQAKNGRFFRAKKKSSKKNQSFYKCNYLEDYPFYGISKFFSLFFVFLVCSNRCRKRF